MAGDLSLGTSIGGWNQFDEPNVKPSTYSDEQYTTVLDMQKFTQEQIQEAERVAREMAVIHPISRRLHWHEV